MKVMRYSEMRKLCILLIALSSIFTSSAMAEDPEMREALEALFDNASIHVEASGNSVTRNLSE